MRKRKKEMRKEKERNLNKKYRKDERCLIAEGLGDDGRKRESEICSTRNFGLVGIINNFCFKSFLINSHFQGNIFLLNMW